MHARNYIGLTLGACTPYVLRENVDDLAEEGAYALVGECPLHGLMYDERISTGEIQDTDKCPTSIPEYYYFEFFSLAILRHHNL